jgi:amino acid transporter
VSTVTEPPGLVSASLARTRLGPGRVASFALSAVAPLTVSAGVVPIAYAVTGLVGLAVIFPVVGVVLAVFSSGYVAMARLVPNAGALYALITNGLGKPAGVAAGAVAWVSYTCFAMALYGSIGAVTKGLARDWAGISAPWWVWALVAWALVSLLGLTRVRHLGVILGILLVGELLVTLLYAAVFLLHPAGGTVTISTLSPTRLFAPGMGAAVALAVTSFVGFESGAVFAEESRSPRTVSRAIYAALGLAAGVYTLVAWALTVTVGPDRIVATSVTEGTDMVFNLAALHLPRPLVNLGLLFFTTSMFAALGSFRSIADRYLFSMGREGVLPRAFGRTATGTGAPLTASVFMTVLSVAVIALYAFSGADPLLKLFYFGAGLGGVGVLLLLCVTSIAVVVYFAVRPDEAATVTKWQRAVAPALATTALVTMLVAVLTNIDVLLGVGSTSPLRWLPAAFAVPAILGVAWALILRATRPEVYAAVGLGPDAATAGTTTTARTVKEAM